MIHLDLTIMGNKNSFLKKLILLVWLVLIIFCLSYYFIHPERFTVDEITFFLQKFNAQILIVYFTVSVLRGFTMIPSTPFVLAGAIILPEQPLLALFISLLSISISSTMIYYFSDYLNLGDRIEKVYPVHKIKHTLNKPIGVFAIFLWSVFPAMPTDIVCYAAGSVKMNFIKFITAVVLGELLICTFYIFFVGKLFNN